MICDKCNHKLPEDSEFCQYCGNKIEVKQNDAAETIDEKTNQSTENISDVDNSVFDIENLDLDNMTRAEIIQAFVRSHDKDVSDIMKENEMNQPDHENEADFGLVPQKTIFTFAMDSVGGEHEYLKKLRTVTGKRIKWNRRGSMSVDEINGMIDVYDTFLPSGEKYKTLYINMYGAKTSSKPPAGFAFNDKTSTNLYKRLKRAKSPKIKYCSRCGSLIDNETKKCTGCGKQYFKGIKINKFSVTVGALSVAVLVYIIINIVQFNKANNLSWKMNYYKEKYNDAFLYSDTISSSGKREYNFYKKYAVVVDENSMKYHKYGCEDFDESSFWIYNIDAAKQKGYYACPKCND